MNGNTPDPAHAEEAVGGACPSFIIAMDVIGRRWTGIIIKAIGEGNAGFAEISRFVGHVGDTMLAKRLRELEADCLIERTVTPGPPVRVSYTLTVAGGALLPILDDITGWGHAYSLAESRESNTAKRHEGAH